MTTAGTPCPRSGHSPASSGTPSTKWGRDWWPRRETGVWRPQQVFLCILYRSRNDLGQNSEVQVQEMPALYFLPEGGHTGMHPFFGLLGIDTDHAGGNSVARERTHRHSVVQICCLTIT